MRRLQFVVYEWAYIAPDGTECAPKSAFRMAADKNSGMPLPAVSLADIARRLQKSNTTSTQGSRAFLQAAYVKRYLCNIDPSACDMLPHNTPDTRECLRCPLNQMEHSAFGCLVYLPLPVALTATTSRVIEGTLRKHLAYANGLRAGTSVYQRTKEVIQAIVKYGYVYRDAALENEIFSKDELDTAYRLAIPLPDGWQVELPQGERRFLSHISVGDVVVFATMPYPIRYGLGESWRTLDGMFAGTLANIFSRAMLNSTVVDSPFRVWALVYNAFSNHIGAEGAQHGGEHVLRLHHFSIHVD